ncbi:MAG: GTP cyclohydrolase II [Patescibacteria group bacterium]|nr:GTP cyclohydrolase II [Patescibacteria group bacterium]
MPKKNYAPIRLAATANLPTRFGKFKIHIFTSHGREHAVLQMGNVAGRNAVIARLHSQCLTGDTFGSRKCDCADQLHTALKKIARARRGLLIYLNQEGRGIGLTNKIRAYALQDKGLDTVEANLALGFAADERDYRDAADILHHLRVRTVRLLTNNPAKICQLTRYGITVTERLPLIAAKNRTNQRYLAVKAAKLGHQIPV